MMDAPSPIRSTQMSNFKVSSKLAAASLLAIAAALAAPSAFADNHYRGADRGQVSHDHGPSRDSHRDRRDNRGHHHGHRQDISGPAPPHHRHRPEHPPGGKERV